MAVDETGLRWLCSTVSWVRCREEYGWFTPFFLDVFLHIPFFSFGRTFERAFVIFLRVRHDKQVV